MKISVNEINLSFDFDESKYTSKHIPVFLLHGFTGRGSDWNFLHSKLPGNILPITVDIIGHGQSDSPFESKFYSGKKLVEQLHAMVKYFGFRSNIFLGYSMGGRIALSYAAVHSNFICGLILESVSPGIINEAERKLRLENDKILAESIERHGMGTFINNWVKQPFFNSQKKIGEEKLSKLISGRCFNNPVGLSNIITQFSQGKMQHRWDILNELNFPVLLISGDSDKKYCEINNKVSGLLKNASCRIALNTGHNVHLEKEEEFVNFVNTFLKIHFK